MASVGSDLFSRLGEIEASGADLSVIDTKALLLMLCAFMHKPHRARFLVRIYEHLERNQPRIDLVNGYVGLLESLGLIWQGA